MNATRRWTRGKQIDFEVFMNIHLLDGFGLASDVRLPDLPVARDEDNLYVLDYGPGGPQTPRARAGHADANSDTRAVVTDKSRRTR